MLFRSSYLEQILLKDPRDFYASMDLSSRGRYLQQIEIFATRFGVSELHIARVVVDLALAAEKEMSDSEFPNNLMLKRTHVGYYLLDDGAIELEDLQKGKKTNNTQKRIAWITSHLGTVFISVIALFTGMIIIAAYKGAIETDPSNVTVSFFLSKTWFLQLLTAIVLIIQIGRAHV